MASTIHKGSCDSITSPVGSQILPSSEDTVLMQQLLLEQQKQQTLLINQQELLMGLQEGHKELMEKVQHREAGVDHNSEREWWIKKLLQQSSVPTIKQKNNNNNSLRSQSFPSLGNSSQRHLVSFTETTIFSNTTISMQQNNEKSPLNKALSSKEATDEETIPESLGVLAQASVAVEACSDISPTHSPTYQSCGTNTHNLVDIGVNTAPLTVDICIGTEWSSSSSSDEESEEQSKTETSPQTVDSSDTSPPAKEQHHTPATTTVKESQSEDYNDAPSQPKATTTTSSSGGNSSYIDLINQEVLSRSTDGYYYWGVVLQYDPQQDVYIVEDLDSRQQLMMARSDFITETQDAARAVLQLYDRALAPRVLSPNCFLPGGCAPTNSRESHLCFL